MKSTIPFALALVLAACGDSPADAPDDVAATTDTQEGDAAADTADAAPDAVEDTAAEDSGEDDTRDTTEEDTAPEDTGEDAPADATPEDTATDTTPGACVDGVQTLAEAFLAGGTASAITEVDCTLDNGTDTTCYRVEIIGEPANHEVGPFCPRSIDDSAEAGGIWIDSGEVFDIDGEFIVGLADYYGDDNWLLYDPETGEVNVTDTQESCDGAARPDVAPEYQNHCVECELSYLGGGVVEEFLIPVHPVLRGIPGALGRAEIGVALNGVRLDAPAPVEAILGAYTIAAFDDCGGHINLAAGYHYHAATGCSDAEPGCDGHAALIGFALDGHGIYAMRNADGLEPDDLDECRGHTDEVRGYHYHVASAGENMFIGCYAGQTAGAADDGGPGGPGTDPIGCDEVPPGRPCCGDGICDGPETAANCEDC